MVSSKEFFLPLPLPPSGQVACGVRFAGAYHSVFSALLLPHRLESAADVRKILSKMSLHLRLTSQEGILRLKLGATLDGNKPGGSGILETRGPPLATWKVIFEVDLFSGRLLRITTLQREAITYFRDGTSSKDEGADAASRFGAHETEALRQSMEKHFQAHHLPSLREMFCAFAPKLVSPSALAARLPEERTEKSVQVTYETLVPRHLPLECVWENKRYEFMDYHELKIRIDVINTLVVCHDPLTGSEVVVAGVSFNKETGEIVQMRKHDSARCPEVETLLELLEEQHPFAFMAHLRARSRLVEAIASFESVVDFESESSTGNQGWTSEPTLS